LNLSHKISSLIPAFKKNLLLRKFGWSALIGSASALVLNLILFLICNLLQRKYMFPVELGRNLFGVSAFAGIADLCFLPHGLFSYILQSIKDVHSRGDFSWFYLRYPGFFRYVFSWVVSGAIFGIVFLSWAKRPLKRFLKITIILVVILGVISVIVLVDRIPWIKGQETPIHPPPGYSGAYLSLPYGFKVEEISGKFYKDKHKTQTLLRASGKAASTGSNSTQNTVKNLTQEIGDTEYRLVSCRDPWTYSILKKAKSDSEWELFGPFLPCLGIEGFPVFDLTDNSNFIEDDCIKWIIRESDPNDEVNRVMPAHKRSIRRNGKIWRCSIPLAAYSSDDDNDKLTDIEEAALLTDPNKPDTDGDGILDGNDSSPLGWYKSSKGSFGLYGDTIENMIKPYFPRDKGIGRMPSFGTIDIIESSDIRLHADVSGVMLLTINNEEERIFRNRVGLSEIWGIVNTKSPSQEIFLFGLLGLISVESHSGGLEGSGRIFLCLRTFKGHWKIIFSQTIWVS